VSDNSHCKISTADVLTLLWHKQHVLGAAIKVIRPWISRRIWLSAIGRKMCVTNGS